MAEAMASETLDLRRRRARYRAWHRGIREMDLIMGSFADAELPTLSEAELAAFERLLEVPDPELYAWVTGEAEIPPDHRTSLFGRMAEFQARPVAIPR